MWKTCARAGGRGSLKDVTFDPAVHHRRSVRLQDYDYREAGAYFVTICTVGRTCIFGTIGETIELSPLGEIVEETWSNLPSHYPGIELDEFTVMPNHVHGVIGLMDLADLVPGAGLKPAPTVDSEGLVEPAGNSAATVKSTPLSEIVRGFKTFSARRINEHRGTPGRAVWQRNYYERVIRSERELKLIRTYIAENPSRWADDHENPEWFARRGRVSNPPLRSIPRSR
jgi:REP element-mobilizing transposase RayT